jgi:hypothetical protein
MRAQARLAELFIRYEEAIKNETQDQALAIRKLIRAEVERENKK